MIVELNDQARKAIEKIEGHLEAHASSMVTTANVCISLGTALAGGLAVLAHDALPKSPDFIVLGTLGFGAVTAAGSLLAGILVLDSRSRIADRAVKMWDASKQLVLSVLLEGEGDEDRTQTAYVRRAQEIRDSLTSSAGAFQAEYDKMSNRLTWQVGLLLASVVFGLVCTYLAYKV